VAQKLMKDLLMSHLPPNDNHKMADVHGKLAVVENAKKVVEIKCLN